MNRVYALGDIHGKWQPIRDFYEINKEKEKMDGSDSLILLGDAGLNYFFNKRDEETKAKLMEFPFTYFVIRGNHEERPSICMEKFPNKWHTETFWGNTVYVENDYPRIKYALDEVAVYDIPYYYFCSGTRENRWNDEGYQMSYYRTLVVPGAYSVDKEYRLLNGWSWFEQEQLNEEERNHGLNLINNVNYFDLVLSHTCPCIFEPTDLFLSFIDQSMVDKTMERYLGYIEYTINYKAWMWGHFHAFRDYPRTDGRKKLMLFNGYAVDINEYIENDEVIKYES